MYSIEKNVPMPASNNSRRIYPFASMSVGDSFLVPTSDDKDAAAKKRTKVAAAITADAKRFGRKFATRQVEGGVRVWRVR